MLVLGSVSQVSFTTWRILGTVIVVLSERLEVSKKTRSVQIFTSFVFWCRIWSLYSLRYALYVQLQLPMFIPMLSSLMLLVCKMPMQHVAMWWRNSWRTRIFFSNSLGFIPTAAVSGSVSRLEVIENDYKLTGYFLTKPFSLPLTTPRSEKQWEKMYSPARPEKPLSSHHHFMDVWCDWNLFYGTIRGTQDDITGIIKLTHFFGGIKFDV